MYKRHPHIGRRTFICFVFLASPQALLRRGGLLIANELTSKTDFLTLTFGLTDGWWLYDDPEWRMPGEILTASSSTCRQRKMLCAGRCRDKATGFIPAAGVIASAVLS